MPQFFSNMPTPADMATYLLEEYALYDTISNDPIHKILTDQVAYIENNHPPLDEDHTIILADWVSEQTAIIMSILNGPCYDDDTDRQLNVCQDILEWLRTER